MVYLRLKTDTLVSMIAFRLIRSFRDRAVASTIGKTIHLHAITPEAFVERRAFLRHELQHAIQFNTIKFFWLKYIWQTIRHGYFNNPYEIEAREKALHEFPRGYAVYTDEILVMDYDDYAVIFWEGISGVDELNKQTGLKFTKYPKIMLR